MAKKIKEVEKIIQTKSKNDNKDTESIKTKSVSKPVKKAICKPDTKAIENVEPKVKAKPVTAHEPKKEVKIIANPDNKSTSSNKSGSKSVSKATPKSTKAAEVIKTEPVKVAPKGQSVSKATPKSTKAAEVIKTEPVKVAPKGQSVSKAIPKSTKAAEVIKTELTKIVLESEKTQVKPKISEREIIADKAVVKKETIVEAPAVMVTSARYSDNELQEFTGVIQHEKVSALEELRMLKERLDDLTSFDIAEESMIYSMHMGEQGSEAQEKEKTYAQIQRIHEYIKKLEDALERIKNKTYGICRVCGCLIARERLMAVPITTLSASYKIHQKCPEDGIDKIEALKK